MRSKLFVGSEALARGDLTEYELRRWHEAAFRDVYAPKPWVPTLRDRTIAAWLWSKRKGVVAGAAAAALHGASWVDATTPIELIWTNGRPPPGVIVRNETLTRDEVTTVAGIPVTTKTRTAFDLARYLDRDEAVARLDALKRATAYQDAAVLELVAQHQGARGLKALRTALPLVDAGAMSPRETWLRLLLIDAGLPPPAAQVPVTERFKLIRTLDLAYEEFGVGVEYDGDQHRTDRVQYAKDVRVKRTLAQLGWDVTYVIKEDRADAIVRSVRAALLARGWRP